MCGAICSMHIYPYLAIPVVLANRINPYKFAVTDLLGPTAMENPIVIVLVIVAVYMMHIEAMRMIPYFMIILIIPILLLMEMLDNLSKCGMHGWRLRKMIGYLQMIQIALR